MEHTKTKADLITEARLAYAGKVVDFVKAAEAKKLAWAAYEKIRKDLEGKSRR